MNRYAGGLWGLLIGDALGVPYEFNPPDNLPPMEQLEMTPPHGFRKTYSGVPEGTWSDDGAQALCLLESLLDCDQLELNDFSKKMVLWFTQGLWTPDGVVFDIGIQTQSALRAIQRGVPPEESGNLNPNGKGNGSLMRTLPLALWHPGSDRDLVLDAHRQSLPTHGHPCNQICCAWYCLTARRLLEGEPFSTAYRHTVDGIRSIYHDMPVYLTIFESFEPDEPMQGTGTGYVIDCLKSAFMVLGRTSNYETAVRQAIALGNDTDTTACVTGGLAGILYGLEYIPPRWMNAMRGKDSINNLLKRLTRWRSTN